jgi:hypothetical protein
LKDTFCDYKYWEIFSSLIRKAMTVPLDFTIIEKNSPAQVSMGSGRKMFKESLLDSHVHSR